MKYIIETVEHVNFAQKMNEEAVDYVIADIGRRMENGTLLASYSKVGGGSVWIVESEGNAELYRTLQTMHVDGVRVIPVVEVLDVLRAHKEFHQKLREAGPVAQAAFAAKQELDDTY
jgi:hypothetical protein